MSIGVTFGLSTLTAAGFGQCVSDVAGFTCGGLVDAMVAKLNLPHHQLTPVQLSSRYVRLASTVGGCVGVVIGCLLGMTSLLFMDTERASRMKNFRELTSIFESVVHDGCTVVRAEKATLWVKEPDEKLWSRVVSGSKKATVVETPEKGLVGYCAKTGEMVNTKDAHSDERFNMDVDRRFGHKTKTVLTVPIKDNEDGTVLGVVQMINKKKNDDGTEAVFDETDEKLTKMLASHVAAFLRIVQ